MEDSNDITLELPTPGTWEVIEENGGYTIACEGKAIAYIEPGKHAKANAHMMKEAKHLFLSLRETRDVSEKLATMLINADQEAKLNSLDSKYHGFGTRADDVLGAAKGKPVPQFPEIPPEHLGYDIAAAGGMGLACMVFLMGFAAIALQWGVS